jgi:hypothetical protein
MFIRERPRGPARGPLARRSRPEWQVGARLLGVVGAKHGTREIAKKGSYYPQSRPPAPASMWRPMLVLVRAYQMPICI